MPKRTYIGSSAAVEVPLPDGEFTSVKKGEAVEVDDETARSLDESGNWTSASTSPPATPATTKPAVSGEE